jgi:hypothetical protein
MHWGIFDSEQYHRSRNFCSDAQVCGHLHRSWTLAYTKCGQLWHVRPNEHHLEWKGADLMAVDTKYGAEVNIIVDVMIQRKEGVPIRYPEIEALIRFPVTNSLFHKILSSAVRKLAEKKVPVHKLRNQKKIGLAGGLVKLSPGEVPQRAYDRNIKGLNRTANNAIKDINTVEEVSLSDEELTVARAVRATAKMTQLIATEDTQDKLKDEIRKGDKLTDAKEAFAKLLKKNL